MKLPPSLSLQLTAHGHGDKGMAFYEYQDAEGLGVVMDARRADRRSPFVETWRFRWLPAASFRTYEELLRGLEGWSDNDVAAEKARWPVMRDPIEERTAPGGSCWLHPDRLATHRAYAQTCWIASAGQVAMLCAQCALAAESDISVVTRANAQRRADWAARQKRGSGNETENGA